MKNIRYLFKKGLLNQGLIKLTPELLKRYNDCLESMGIPRTKRKSIYIDGVGWSPQVARELGNPYYLCSGGLVNPVAIIVSPDQYKKPVYFPIFSWMRGAMRSVFEKYHRQIIDITATNIISLDCDNGLSSLEGPGDLLLLSSIVMKPNTGSMCEEAKNQAQLIAKFGEGLNCLEPEFRDPLVAHARRFGDLRRRKLDMGPVTFDLFNEFYTAAFDGAAVLRSVEGSDMLLLESQSVFESIKGSDIGSDARAFYLFDPEGTPFRLLEKAGMISIPIDKFRADPTILEEKKNILLSQSLCDCEEGIDWENSTNAKRKTLLKKYGAKVPHVFAELERFIAGLKRGGGTPELSQELWYFLAAPSERQPPSTQEVLWILLSKREPRNIFNLYTYDKNSFLARYGEWTEAKQKWAADYIAARYQPRMNQP